MITHFVLWCYLLIQGMAHIHRRSAFSKRRVVTGHVADVCPPTSHDDLGSYDGGDSEVKITRPATGALCRPLCGNKTRSGAISKKAAHRLAATSRVTSGTGSSRDGQRNSTKCNLKDWSDRAGPEILGLRRKRARLRREEEPAEAPC
jgi:hypothetical protein